nr:hypothetical protein [Tanacetum cinerariifolium]
MKPYQITGATFKPYSISKPAEETKVITDTTQSLEASKSAEKQDNQTQTVDATKSPDSNDEESNFVTKEHSTDKINATSNGDVALPNSSAGVLALSDPFGHLRSVPTTIFSKVDQLESHITKQVFDKLKSYVPSLVPVALKETIPGLFTDALKDSFPCLIQASIQNTVQQSMREQTSLFQAQIGRKVKAKVRTGIRHVTERLGSLQGSIQDNSDRVFDLKEAIKTMNFLLEAGKVFKRLMLRGRSGRKPI